MKSKEQVREFLHSLQWNRLTKKELEIKCQAFLETTNRLENSTDPDFKEVDYSFVITNGIGSVTRHFIDIEIWYLKGRNKTLLITGAELLDYQE